MPEAKTHQKNITRIYLQYIHIKKGTANLNENCDIMIDQVRAIDNKRLLKKVGELPESLSNKVKENLTIILDLN